MVGELCHKLYLQSRQVHYSQGTVYYVMANITILISINDKGQTFLFCEVSGRRHYITEISWDFFVK